MDISIKIARDFSRSPGARYYKDGKFSGEEFFDKLLGPKFRESLDSNSKFISTDIKVFDCSFSETSYSMEVVAPPRATIANVYVSGHTSIPIIFREVSFKL